MKLLVPASTMERIRATVNLALTAVQHEEGESESTQMIIGQRVDRA